MERNVRRAKKTKKRNKREWRNGIIREKGGEQNSMEDIEWKEGNQGEIGPNI